MLVHLKVRGSESDDRGTVAILDLEIDNIPASGICGIRIREDKLQAFIDRIDPDYFQGEMYFPGMPIDLKHIRIVQ